jgi:hypothetical protein
LPHDSADPNPPSRALKLRGRGHSPAATDIGLWCADLARLLHVARQRGADGVDACAHRGRLVADTVVLVQDHGPFELEVTPRSIVLGDEPVFVAEHSNAPTGGPALEHELSWILHRDGVRVVRFERGVDESEAAAWIDALLLAAPASATHEDLVTMLWDSELEHVTLRT